ncbi:MAG: aromatic ring-hydroxylating dioxygenase subunit alpha [Rhodospirillaceae bacterium]|nr:aromatic ring-hydroxylating dioxygenase subunit alpha [Rhodospirillaceae bacterium]
MDADKAGVVATADDRGLANRWYTDADAWDAERDALFARGWACLGHEGEVAAPGDVLPKDLMGLPLLLVRTKAGTVNVFHNVCRHRGMKLADKPCPGRGRIICPYHAWSYDLDGTLCATPHIGGEKVHEVAGFDRSRWGLLPVRSAVWFGLVFVNIDGAAPPFEQVIAPLARRWQAWSLDGFRLGGADCRWALEVRANWKLAVENYCEAYHLPMVHPGLNQYSRLGDHYNITHQGRAEGPEAWFAGQGTRVYNPARGDGECLAPLPDLPPALHRVGEYVALFPNALLGVHIDQAFAMVLEPQAPDRTVERVFLAYVGDAATDPAFAGARAANLRAWQDVFVEDVFAVEGMQAGRHSPAFDGGAFTPLMDAPTLVFHRWAQARLVAERIAGAG